MIGKILKKFSGAHYKRYIKQTQPAIKRINELEQGYQSLTDEQIKAKTPEFMERFKNGESLDDLLEEAFAVVKNTARRLCGQTFDVCDHDLEWNMVHYDVQLMGGMALHEKRIAEMATGEGKTLVSTLPLYLNALSGRNCQLVTVNDYLARRDSQWMGALFKYLGLTVGCIQNSISSADRREAYCCNLTYGTASEFGFDYLRDNGMATTKDDQVQRDHFYCIIDEVDSVLVDEARTPLIISGPMQEDNPMPFPQFKGAIDRLVRQQTGFCDDLAKVADPESKPEGEELEKILEGLYQVKHGMPTNSRLLRLMEVGFWHRAADKFDLDMNQDFNKTRAHDLKENLFYTIDEKNHQADLTEKGRDTLRPDDSDAFVIPDLPTIFMEIENEEADPEVRDRQKSKAQKRFEQVSGDIHCISQLLRAYSLYEKDKEYVVQGGKVMIVDENTGRLMPGRRWSNGLHQAVEAKEDVAIEKETKTYATITIQNFFRMYDKLAGMTGTAETEASEFNEIYKLGVMVIPTNQPCIREDLNDVVYKTRREKFNAVIKHIQEANGKGQPVLVGTASVEASEVLGRMLKKTNITHNVLNAKFHEQEAEIVSRAGQKGAVTIATNMAGRGTDIKLGEGIDDLGGLLVLGTERHESRRTDRQLRGRCARQGDPGMSKFFIALEDNLMRLFASAGPISKMLENSFEEGDELEHPLLNMSIENAQKKVEQQNFSIRKRLLQYDDVLNKQRQVIYEIRNQAIHSETPREIIDEMVEDEVIKKLEALPPNPIAPENEGELKGILDWVNTTFPVAIKIEDLSDEIPPGRKNELILEHFKDCILGKVKDAYDVKASLEESDSLVQLERYVIIRSIDRHWQDHLTEMEELRRSVGLRGYGQKDPLNEYKGEAYRYFEELMENVRTEICNGVFRSSTNLEAFQNMLSILNKNVQVEGPSGNDSLVGLLQGDAQVQASGGGSGVDLPKPQAEPLQPIRRSMPKVGRNEPCPCGSGKKFKKCCGEA